MDNETMSRLEAIEVFVGHLGRYVLARGDDFEAFKLDIRLLGERHAHRLADEGAARSVVHFRDALDRMVGYAGAARGTRAKEEEAPPAEAEAA